MRAFENLIGLSGLFDTTFDTTGSWGAASAGDCVGAVGRSPSPIASSPTAKRPLGVAQISCRNVAGTDASGSSYEVIFGDTGNSAPPVIAERPAGDAQPPAPAKPRCGTDAEIKAAIKSYIADEKSGRSPNMNRAVDYVLERFPRAGRDRVRKIYCSIVKQGRGRPPLSDRNAPLKSRK